MKKILLIISAAVCTLCLSLAFACKKEPKYYTLTFEKTDGVTYNSEIPSGYEVKDGATVSFSITLASNAVGDPVVKANEDTLSADGNGTYSFKMKGDTSVTVNEIYVLNNYTVIFDRGDYFIHYYDTDGKELTSVSKDAGEQIRFKIDVSVYYGDSEYSVVSNTTIIKPDNSGYYNLTVSENATVSVRGLQEEEAFSSRANAGDGTADNPYKIEKPIDLFALANFVRDDVYTYANTAHYILMNDIDMKGEQLFIIGDSENSFFAGTFDGNGKTISNYRVEDTVFDATTQTDVFMPYVGLFGYVAATVSSTPSIYNLHLKNFTIDVNGAPYHQMFAVGGIAAFAVGANITGCSAQGVITVDGDAEYPCYVGGIVGQQMSAYGSNTRTYSTVTSTSSDVEIRGESGYIFSAGGISGYLMSYEERTAATILNCYSTGDVYGALHTGGIVGMADAFTSVQGCYSTGSIEARSSLGIIDGGERYAYAYGGGIAGSVQNDAVIADCFSVSDVYAQSSAGNSFAKTGAIAGNLNAGGKTDSDLDMHAQPALVMNCLTKTDEINDTTIKSALGWHESDWDFSGEGYPVINREVTSKTFTVTVNLGSEQINSKGSLTLSMTDRYVPVTYWYILGFDNFAEFITADSGKVSYGYFFDSELKNRVPFGYTPMTDVTLYAGFANYSEVAGDYYLENYDGYVRLNADGTLVYRNGALSHTSYYYYDGSTITLCDTFFGVLAGEERYVTFLGTVEGGKLSVYSNSIFTTSSPLTAVKKSETLVYGNYYSDDYDYVFNPDGTGERKTATNTERFTFTIGANSLTAVMQNGGTQFTCNLTEGVITSFGSDTLTAYDKYQGVWEKSASSHKVYTFDGKGNFTYEYYGYTVTGGEAVKTDIEPKVTGTYTVNHDGTISLSNGLNATLTAEGFVSVNDFHFYKQSSFAGTWNSFNNDRPVEIVLNGISDNGVGSGVIFYKDAYEDYEISYEAAQNGIVLYINDMQYGVLSYDVKENVLSGKIYFPDEAKTADVKMFLYDDFKGEWISDVLELVEFNGLGNYQFNGTNLHTAVKGTVKVNGVSAGSYTLVNHTLTGSFRYNDVDYNISYNELTGKISVTGGSGDFVLEGRDMMYGVDLKDGGSVYSFDGRGNLASGGTLTVTGDNAGEYGYTINGASVDITKNSAAWGSIAISAAGYELSLVGGSASTLYISNPFTGNWIIAGDGGAFNIGEFNASTHKATGVVGSDATEFTYYPDGNYVTFTDGVRMYVNLLTATGGVTELSVSSQRNASDNYSVCVKADTNDGYKGVWTASDGGTLEFDGLGACHFVGGTLVRKDATGKVIGRYDYNINKKGVPHFISEVAEDVNGKPTNVRKNTVFETCLSTDGDAYVNGSKAGKIVIANDLYEIEAYGMKIENALLVIDLNKTYTFDGMETLTCSDGSSFEYTIISRDNNRYYYRLLLTDSQNTEFEATLDYGGGSIELKIMKKIYGVKTENGSDTVDTSVTYYFNGLGAIYGSDGKNYSYETITLTDEENLVFEATVSDASGNAYTAVLKYGKDGTATLKLSELK